MVDEAQLIPAKLLEFYAKIFPTHYTTTQQSNMPGQAWT